MVLVAAGQVVQAVTAQSQVVAEAARAAPEVADPRSSGVGLTPLQTQTIQSPLALQALAVLAA